MLRQDIIFEHVIGKRVLDIGCVGSDVNEIMNPNHLHRLITEQAVECLGVDSSHEGVELLCEQGMPAIEADAQNFILDNKFDIVVALDVFEHLHDWKGFFSSIKQCLADQGEIIITLPNPWWWQRVALVFVKGHGNPHSEHTAWFCLKTAEVLLLRYGFKVTYSCYCSGLGSKKSSRFLWFLRQPFRHDSIIVVAKTT